MKERAFSITNKGSLLGIISEPDKEKIIEHAPGVIILNSGLIHKVGPFRINTEMSRRISENGFITVRFDLSGIGDSKIKLNQGDRWDIALEDVRNVMALLNKDYGTKEYILIGLCSGSDNSYRISLAENRVVGTVNLDGYSFITPGYYMHYYGCRLLTLRWIINKKNSIVENMINKLKKRKKEVKDPEVWVQNREFPSVEKATNDFQILVSRGVKMLYIYTGGVAEYNNHKFQLQKALRKVNFKTLLDLEYYPYAQHTYTTMSSRRKVVSRVANWVVQNFGQSNSGASDTYALKAPKADRI